MTGVFEKSLYVHQQDSKMTTKDQPVSRVRWLPLERLRANSYNPNVVAPPELELLVVSILEDGWTQPVVTLPEAPDGSFQIVDGYHRWTVSADPRVAKLTGGQVPTVQVGLDPVHRMMSTIRHNRARGTHAVVLMPWQDAEASQRRPFVPGFDD